MLTQVQLFPAFRQLTQIELPAVMARLLLGPECAYLKLAWHLDFTLQSLFFVCCLYFTVLLFLQDSVVFCPIVDILEVIIQLVNEIGFKFLVLFPLRNILLFRGFCLPWLFKGCAEGFFKHYKLCVCFSRKFCIIYYFKGTSTVRKRMV